MNTLVTVQWQTVGEGWTWLYNSRKWHFFRNGRSLCGNFLLLQTGELEGDKDSPDTCAACWKKRQHEKAAL